MEAVSGAPLIKKAIFISAGEQSGEMHGSELIKELRKACGSVKLNITGLGGDQMKAQGVKLLYDINSLAAVGILDVAKKYGFFRNVLNDCLKFVKENSPDAVILIDYPGFNLKFAEELRRSYSGKIIYYISPQIWAWRESRVHKIKKYVDKMLVVFPFEVEFYEKFGITTEYVGHPLVKRIRKFLDENKRTESASGGRKVITVLPGSRFNEIKNHLPVLLKTVQELKSEFDIEVNISKAHSVELRAFDKYLNEMEGCHLVSGSAYELILNSDLVMSKAGTATLECALIGAPHFIFLRTAPINYFLMKPIVNINNIGIVNIIAKENIVKEFIQNDFKASNLAVESKKLLTDDGYRNELKSNLKRVWDILGDKDASLNAADIIKNLALN
jgi:lipid-A-disaccharide synthase